jgi:dipeptidyl aminopeptidase/acylaminoacyl peptidase
MGVSDIELMYTNAWSDFSDDWKRYGMPVLIGDRVADAAQLAATSPLKNVARFGVPVLLAGGELDRRVPIEHAKRFRDEAKKAGIAVEWVEYPGEGHGWGREANEIDFWRRVERFLEQHIGAVAPAK